MTMLMPQDRMISAAFSLRMLKNVWGFKNPAPRKITAPAYMTTNTAMVMISRRLVSVMAVRLLRRSSSEVCFR